MDPYRTLSVGLVDVPTPQLETLLRRILKTELEYPLTKPTLMALGYNEVAAAAQALRGLDQRGVRAVLVAVLAERKARGG